MSQEVGGVELVEGIILARARIRMVHSNGHFDGHFDGAPEFVWLWDLMIYVGCH